MNPVKAEIYARGRTLKDVAREAGVSDVYFYEILNGTRPLSLKLALRLERVLGIPVEPTPATRATRKPVRELQLT